MTGADVKRLREEAGLTQAQLADLIRYTQAGVSLWESEPERELPERAALLIRLALAERERTPAGGAA